MEMTNEELQKLLTSFENEVGHIKQWEIDRKVQLQSVCSAGGSVGGAINKKNNHGLFSLTPEQKSMYGKIGAAISGPKMIQWCRDNNHWEKLAILQTGIPKSEQCKKRISDKLTGRKLSKETCNKMSQSRMGREWNDATINKFKNSARKRCTPISQFDLDGNWIQDWDGFIYVNESLSLNGRAIQLVCNYYRDNLTKGSKQCGGFIWKYKKV